MYMFIYSNISLYCTLDHKERKKAERGDNGKGRKKGSCTSRFIQIFFETLPMIGSLTAYSEAPLAPCYLLDNLNY